MKILLHACCGPCSLEPVRLLHEEGHELTIAFMNSNIHPRTEYDQRFDVLRQWASEEGIPVIEGVYDRAAWDARVGIYEQAKNASTLSRHADGQDEQNNHPGRGTHSHHAARCRACYRMRLDEAAAYASKHGYEGLATTLAVSPYQYTAIIQHELEAACKPYGLTPVFSDYTAYYPEATKRSRELGMYRQNYCGCIYSEQEARAEREERKAAKAEAARARQAKQDEEHAKRVEEQRTYDEKQRKKRAARDAARRAAKQAAQS